jgi:hypothetical protein
MRCDMRLSVPKHIRVAQPVSTTPRCVARKRDLSRTGRVHSLELLELRKFLLLIEDLMRVSMHALLCMRRPCDDEEMDATTKKTRS